MLLMLGVVCIIKYSGLGHEIIKGYTMWSLLTTFIPLIFLAVLMGVRKMHPWNLVAFSCFTLSWAYSLGIACVWLESRLFVSGEFGFLIFCRGSLSLSLSFSFFLIDLVVLTRMLIFFFQTSNHLHIYYYFFFFQSLVSRS